MSVYSAVPAGATLDGVSLPLLLAMVSSFATGVLAHIAVWRIRRPKDDAKALLHFTVTLPSMLSLAVLGGLDLLDGMGLALMFHLGTGFTYMSLYTAAQAASPTSLVLLALRERPLRREELYALFTTDQLAGNSIRSAIDEEFLLEREGRLELGPRGRNLIHACMRLRAIVHLPPGRG